MSVKQKFTGDVAQLEAAYHKIAAQNTKLIEQNRRLSSQTRKHQRSSYAGAGRMIGRLMSMAGAYLSVSQAIQVVTRSIQDKEATERKSRDAAITVADAQAGALRMLGKVSDEERSKFVATVEQITAATRPSGGQATVYKAAASALSGAGGDQALAMAAVRTALQIAPEDAQEAQTIASGLLGLSKASGSKDMRENLGQLLGMATYGRPESLRDVAQHLVPAIVSTVARGGTVREAVPISTAISQGMEDWSGRKAATAAITLSDKLAEWLPEADTYKYTTDRRGKATRELDRAGTGLKSAAERIEYLWTHPEERAKFIAATPFQVKAQASIEQLLTGPETYVGGQFQKARAGLPTADQARADAAEMIEGIKKPWHQQIAAQQRANEALVEELRMTGKGQEAGTAAAYQWGGEAGLGDMLEASGAGLTRRWSAWSDYFFDSFSGEKEAYARQLRTRQLELVEDPSVTGPMGLHGDVTRADLKSAAVLGRRLAEMGEDPESYYTPADLNNLAEKLGIEFRAAVNANAAGQHLDAHAEPN